MRSDCSSGGTEPAFEDPANAGDVNAIPSNSATIRADQDDSAAWCADRINALSDAEGGRRRKAGGIHSWEYNHDPGREQAKSRTGAGAVCPRKSPVALAMICPQGCVPRKRVAP